MNMKCVLSAAAVLSSLAVQAFEVVNVTASQRWPWNNLVDVDYEITGAAVGEAFRIDLTASSSGGTKTYCASTYRTEPVGATGENRITWDFGADFPDVRATDMQVSVTATPITPTTEIYCVIDLSAGPTATKYPVRYTLTGPAHVPGASGEKCQTTEMWLKRVQKGAFNFGSSENQNGLYRAKFTKDFYMGLFECTQQQWALVTGNWPSSFTNAATRASRPVETIYFKELIGHWNWPNNQTISATSFVGLMRAKTNLSTFNMPTEAQWEYTMRAGSTGGQIAPSGHMLEYGRFSDSGGNPSAVKTYNETPDVAGTAFVGSPYHTNNWGFYDMCGNVGEWCIDSFISNTPLKELYAPTMAAQGYVEDPTGPSSCTSHGQSSEERPLRGGRWDGAASAGVSTARSSPLSKKTHGAGVRFCVTCE